MVEIVLHTPPHLLEGIGVATVAVDLSPTGNARLDVVATETKSAQRTPRFARSRVGGALRARIRYLATNTNSAGAPLPAGTALLPATNWAGSWVEAGELVT
jgi:hypothetical protein